MAAADWLAAVMGGLQGGLQGHQWNVARRRQQELDSQHEADREFDREHKRRQLQRLNDDDLRRGYGELIATIGPGGEVSGQDAAGMRRVGMGGQIEDEMTLPSSSFTGYVGLPDTDQPTSSLTRQTHDPAATGRTLVRETAPQRTAGIRGDLQWSQQQAAKRESDARDAESERTLSDLRRRYPHLAPVLDYARATGKPPTLGEGAFEVPGAKDEREFKVFERRERLSDLLTRNRAREREKRLDARRSSTDPVERAAQRVYDETFKTALEEKSDEPESAVQLAERAFEAAMGRPRVPVSGVMGVEASPGESASGAVASAKGQPPPKRRLQDIPLRGQTRPTPSAAGAVNAEPLTRQPRDPRIGKTFRRRDRKTVKVVDIDPQGRPVLEVQP